MVQKDNLKDISGNKTRNALEIAKGYKERGWVPIPVAPSGKKTGFEGWQDLALDSVDVEAEFDPGDNIGILLGEPSGRLVDIDLDCVEATRAAGLLLPPTNLVFGRAGNPNSHWLYRVDGPGERELFADPDHKAGDPDKRVLVEYRANGCYTVFPGSIHESGEPIDFDRDGEPAEIGQDELLVCVARLAAASLLARRWPKGGRHHAALSLAGGLLNAGWTEEEALEFIKAVCVAAKDDEVDDRLKAVKTTAERIRSGETATGWPTLSNELGKTVVDRVTTWLGIESGGGVAGIGHNQGPKSGKDRMLTLTDTGNANRLVERYGKDIRYCYGRKRWFAWDGARWVEDINHRIDGLAEETVRSIVDDATGADTTFAVEQAKWAKASLARQRLTAMVEQAKHKVAISQDKFDGDPWLLNCENGTLDLRTGELRDHCRDDLITKMVPVSYDPEAECPTFMRFLGEITKGDEELAAFLKRAMGYSLTGVTDEQCFFVVQGPGANGKSTLLNAFGRLLGDYSAQTPTDTLLAKKGGGGIPNDLARLVGMRFVQATEVGDGQQLHEPLIKQVTGGDVIPARFLHQEYFEFVPIMKLWMATNHRPEIKGTDDGMWRRLHLVLLDANIPKENHDHELKGKLDEEQAGILAWAVQGCLEWQNEGLKPPAKVENARKVYREDMDEVRQFLADNVAEQKGSSITVGSLYDSYQMWADDERIEPANKKTFGKRLKELGYEQHRTKEGRFWSNVRITSGLEAEFEEEDEAA